MNSFVQQFIRENRLPDSFSNSAENYFIPYLEELSERLRSKTPPFFVGVNGSQGSGKTTFVQFAKAYIESLGFNAVNLSIDDFYLSKQKRLELAQSVHPLFKTRGVPGTHDTGAMKKVFDACLNGDAECMIPRFDKSVDDVAPQENWDEIGANIDIVLMEGWCWGARHQSESLLYEPMNPLEENEDVDGVWRAYSNNSLAAEYEPLYAYMDSWVMLKAPDFSIVCEWRNQQEQHLKDKLVSENNTEHNALMSPEEIERFVQHYERITRALLEQFCLEADTVWELDEQRRIVKVLEK